MGQGSRLVRPRTVTGDGDGLVSHAGMVWLAETADLSGLTVGLSSAMASVPQRRDDAGGTLAQMVLGLADGATCLSDLAALRAQPTVFGPAPSNSARSPRRGRLLVHAPGPLAPARLVTR